MDIDELRERIYALEESIERLSNDNKAMRDKLLFIQNETQNIQTGTKSSDVKSMCKWIIECIGDKL